MPCVLLLHIVNMSFAAIDALLAMQSRLVTGQEQHGEA